MKKEIGPSVKRTARITIDMLIAGIIVAITGDEKWIAIAPVIAGIGKFLRSMFKWSWLPF